MACCGWVRSGKALAATLAEWEDHVQRARLARRRKTGAGRNSSVVARDLAVPRSRAYVSAPGVAYFSRYARSTASRRRPLRVLAASTGMVRSPTRMNPRGSVRNARYQPRALKIGRAHV